MANPDNDYDGQDFSTAAVVTLTCVAAISVATGYYVQPIIQAVGESFQLSSLFASFVVAAFQIGLALGLLALLPLADTISPRKLLLVTVWCQSAALVGVAVSSSFWTLVASAVAVGFFGITPYALPPYASLRTSTARLGFVTGMLTGGVGSGILIARVIAGAVASWAGWRAVFLVGAVGMLASLAPIFMLIGSQTQKRVLPYPALMKSMLEIARSEKLLWSASTIQALSFSSFGIFWLGSAFYLHEHFHWTAGKIGALGMLGLFSIVLAPPMGRLAQRLGLERCRLVAALGGLAAWLMMALFSENLIVLCIAIVLLSVCAVATDICCRTRLYSLSSGIRTRLNAIYTIAMLSCGAVSSALTGWAWQAAGWNGVCSLGGAAIVISAVCAAMSLGPKGTTSRGVEQTTPSS